jgi:hypothetical protein
LGTVVSLGDADPDRSKYIPLGLPKFFVTVDDIAVGSIDTDVSVLLVLYIEVLLVILRALKLKNVLIVFWLVSNHIMFRCGFLIKCYLTYSFFYNLLDILH